MTMCYVYGIIDGVRLDGVPPLGHDQAEVRALPVGDLAAVVSEAVRSEIEASVDNIWRHEQVLGALMERHGVLPMRFGTLCDRDRLASVVAQRRKILSANLQKIRGKVEIALRLSGNDRTEAAPMRAKPVKGVADASGTAYLRARIEDRRRLAVLDRDTRAIVQTVRDRLERLSAAARWDMERAGTLPLKASFLVPKDGVSDFVAAAEALSSRHPEIRVSCTGPWAPYSFVDMDGPAEGAP